MSSAMPWTLVAAWAAFFGFLNTHQRHVRRFQATSAALLFALNTSVLVGSLTGLVLLGYYFFQVSWYWPIVLFILGSAIGGLVFGFLDAMLGQLASSVVAFAGWPAFAVWVFFIVRGLHA